MDDLAAHQGGIQLPSYLDIKRSIISGGLLSCSQAGFNIMLGSLASLFDGIRQHLCLLDPQAAPWSVPALLRPDWIPAGALPQPHREQWCHEEPGGFLLTPRPLFHLLGRMRWHPEERGSWVLSGQCVRQEVDTLPLKRQRVFTMVEYAWLGEDEEIYPREAAALERLMQLCQRWRIPVGLEHDTDRQNFYLMLPDTEPVKVAGTTLITAPVLASFGIERARMLTLGCGVERMLLAFLAAQGTEPGKWQL